MTSAIRRQFEQYSAVLKHYEAYWRLTPFSCADLPWDDPVLVDLLGDLSLDEAEALDNDEERLQALFAARFPELFALPVVASSPEQSSSDPFPFWLTNGIGGRKLAQIEAFIGAIPCAPLPLVEWCAGKGHLGRLLGFQQQRPVTSIEWQQSLCKQGAALAEQHHVPQRFVHADVLSPAGAAVLSKEQQVVALHACGELHLELLRQGVAHNCNSIQLAPCCYHLIDTSRYQPLSEVARQHDLALRQQDLKLAVQGQVTAGARVARLRHTEVQWRLAFHALEAELTGYNEYRPLNSVAKHWFTGGFAEFAHWAAAQHELSLPDNLDWQLYLQRGACHQRVVAQIEVVRHLFRRALETWLVLDRALFLEQHGYSVTLKHFCNYSTTPRNFLISAQRGFCP
jgi:hypothetical protein